MAAPKLIISAGVKYDGKGLNKARKDVHKFGRDVRGLGKLFGVALGTGAILNFAKKSIDAFAKEEIAAKRLAGVLENTGNAMAVIGVEKSLRAMELLTGETGDLRASFTQLYTTLKDVTAAQGALNLAEDIAQATGYDVLTVSTALAKAYRGDIKSLKSLNLVIDSNVLASKDSLEITEALAKVYGGAAAKNATTFSGKLKILKKGFEDAQKSIGKGLVDGLMLATSSANVEELQRKIVDFGEKSGKAIAELGAIFNENFQYFKNAAVAIASIWVADKMIAFTAIAITALGQITKALRLFRTTAVGAAIAQMALLNPLAALAYGVALVAGITAATTTLDKLTSSADKAGTAVAGVMGNGGTSTWFRGQLQAAKEKKALQDKLKLLAAEAKAKKDIAALTKASATFDLSKIQIEAALKYNIDEETRIRLNLQKATLEGNSEEAARLQTLLSENQAKTAELARVLATLPKANDPFADWPGIIANLNRLMSSLSIPGGAAAALATKGYTINAQGTGVVDSGAASAAAAAAAADAAKKIADDLKAIWAAANAKAEEERVKKAAADDAAAAAAEADAARAAEFAAAQDAKDTQDAMDAFAAAQAVIDAAIQAMYDSSFFGAPNVSTGGERGYAQGGGDNYYVTVNAGAVGSEQFLANTITNVLYNNNRNGTSTNYAGSIDQ